ncbi:MULTISPECIES: arginase family protein [unclassified Brevundimonas]|jgi:formiminoglutamase|uniref:arginase family protein n=1 Tax=unclassified Brevundimonas TaxID=2622653 RepID=UPI000C54B003|nr:MULTISPECIES: arginase family protein [unclassified Brevundimonas]MAL87577.1 arginase [Brevundimonas sp.]HAJ02160.1 arginase [Brevundimonas sp.]HAV50969.1 arginase [Brevundimonas sp.]|tara:strand:+ start:1589 stop:2482 length:894 start_codon:yes stop_codon:yes gene_type:complete
MTMEDSEALGWRSVADLIGDHPDAAVALIGAPLNERSLTPGRCDVGPRAFRAVLPRFSTYDVETGRTLETRVHDAGDVALKALGPDAAFQPLRDAVAAQSGRRLTVIIGGNNAVTRPGLHGLGLKGTGLLTLDAHFDLRDTDQGLTNGNPVQALLDDGMDGALISQIGLAPFANTKRAHDKAKAAGISVRTAGECHRTGFAEVVAQELERLSARVDRIYVDVDIDVIDRSQWPASPGARPGGIGVHAFFEATRVIGACPKVRAVDLTEYDPSLEVGDLGSLTAGRWFCELLAGFETR